jgi:maltooligosyltrehalose trehalohydrolase
MGEEYAETAPFQYFVSHSDPAIIEAVRKGRADEFADFHWSCDLPDPQDEHTFQRSKLHWNLREEGQHRVLLDFYKELLRLRREIPALINLDMNSQEVQFFAEQKALFVRRWHDKGEVFAAFCFAEEPASIDLPVPQGRWARKFDSADSQWGGKGSDAPERLDSNAKLTLHLQPSSMLLYERSEASSAM